MRMGEIKSVKVDNWGVFFLQKLQNFFNKTDYCDLTLQFHDNSQLKVHRLVLSACTDYFNVLEHTCEVVDDALIMPNELQADVVVPIVNFMYTGTLEFELRMYGKLLRTAREMNMTVLLKLLEAHRRTMENVSKAQRPPSPKTIRRRGPVPANQSTPYQPPTGQQRRVLASSNAPSQQHQVRRLQPKNNGTNISQQTGRQIGNTTVVRTNSGSPMRMQYGNTTIEEAHSFKQELDDDEMSVSSRSQQQASSPFEQLRKGYNNNKRPANTTFISPPAKKPNIEDVKEFAEQQRMRKQIAAEYGDDPDYEGMLDDDIHNADDDDDDATTGPATTTTPNSASTSRQHQQKTQNQQQQTQNKTPTTITIKQEPGDRPTIVVKDSSNSKMNHHKIISEVLRQYPHLVKSNKNIKLKIMPNSAAQSTKVSNKNAEPEATIVIQKSPNTSQKPTQSAQKTPERSPQTQQPSTTHSQKTNINVPPSVTITKVAQAASASSASSTANSEAATDNASGQKRRIDSKTMHALIALGAENRTGPWLCLHCGVNGRPISIPSYRGFRRHLVNTHKESIDPALCEHCGWRSRNNRELHFHMQMEHKVKTMLYTFPACLVCDEQFIDTNALNQHMVDSHPEDNKQQCIYCNKIFAKEGQLFSHMKSYHKKLAVNDGILDYSDDEFNDDNMADDNMADEEMDIEQQQTEAGVKIISDISLPSSEAAALSTVASGIAASIGISTQEEFMQQAATSEHPKFVNAEGNEMILTEEQRQDIMTQLAHAQETTGDVVMVLQGASGNNFSVPELVSEGVTESNTSLNEDEEEDTQQHIAEERLGEEEEMEDELEQEDDVDADAVDDSNSNTARQSANTAVSSSTVDDEVIDDSEIYSEFISQSGTPAEDENEAAALSTGEKNNKSASADESKESIEHLEWAENLISEHEMEEKAKKIAEENAKKEDISKKIKELTGDWSEDDEDDNIDEEDHIISEAEEDQEKEHSTTKATDDIDNSNTKSLKSDADVDLESSNIEEDEVELAMKQLHKESDNIDDNKAESTGVVPSEKMGETDIKEEEFISEVDEEERMQIDEDEKVEEETKSVLVEKKLAETATGEEHAQETFIGEKDVLELHTKTPQRKNEENLKLLSEINSAASLHKSSENLADEEENDVEKLSASANNNNSGEHKSEEHEEITASMETSTPAVIEEATTSTDVSKKVADVKSIISEWADDEDEEMEHDPIDDADVPPPEHLEHLENKT